MLSRGINVEVACAYPAYLLQLGIGSIGLDTQNIVQLGVLGLHRKFSLDKVYFLRVKTLTDTSGWEGRPQGECFNRTTVGVSLCEWRSIHFEKNKTLVHGQTNTPSGTQRQQRGCGGQPWARVNVNVRSIPHVACSWCSRARAQSPRPSIDSMDARVARVWSGMMTSGSVDGGRAPCIWRLRLRKKNGAARAARLNPRACLRDRCLHAAAASFQQSVWSIASASTSSTVDTGARCAFLLLGSGNLWEKEPLDLSPCRGPVR